MSNQASEIQISVVIPTYNRAHLISRAIESALNQSVQPFEIIVVDDGSKDDTAQVVQAFGGFVKYVYQPNAGSAAARNNGMKHAQCEWVALLDSDDVWVETHLARMKTAVLQTNGKANYYFADTLQPTEKGGGSRWQSVGFSTVEDVQLADNASDWVLMRPQPMMLQSTVFNKQAFLDAGGFLPELRYRDDTHLFMRLGLDGAVCAVSGIGTRMTSDDDPNNRLTLTYDHQLRGSAMQVVMFTDLLATMPQLPPEIQKELRFRLAMAHLSVARHQLKARQFIAFLGQIGRSFSVQPAVFFNSISRKVSKLT